MGKLTPQQLSHSTTYRKNHPDKVRAAQRNLSWKKKGMINSDGTQFTINDYNRMFQVQGGRCKLKTCNKHQTEFKRALAVDHDHKSKKVRGLLCYRCNRLLVSMHTSATAKAVAEYLNDQNI